MGLFQRIREGLHAIRERLTKIVSRKDVPSDVRKEIASVERKVERLEKDVRPQERIIKERISPERKGAPPVKKRYHVNLQLRGVSSIRQYPIYNEDVDADSAEEAIAIAEQHWTERFKDEIDYILSEEAKRFE